MSKRLYEVPVSQEVVKLHEVRASSKKEARQIILDLTHGRIESSDPRIESSYSPGYVGPERVGNPITRINEGAQQHG